jgi:hypothetical protein
MIKNWLAVLLFTFAGVTYGDVVQVEGGSATGILRLDVQGVLYDVSFQNNYYGSIWGFGPSTFGVICTEPGEMGEDPCGLDPTTAIPAVNAINSVLSEQGVSEILFDDGLLRSFYVVPYLFDRLAESGLKGAFTGAEWVYDGEIISGPPVLRPFAVFTPSIPIPAAFYLFASGLGLLGWFRRRQTA